LQELSKTTNPEDEDLQQPHVVALFSLVGMSITGVMALVGFINKNFVLAGVLLLASFIYFLAYFAYKRFNKTALTSSVVLYTLYILMFYLIFTGGVDNTGPLWIFMVAPVSLFLLGLKRGLANIALFTIIISIIMFLPDNLIQHALYSTKFKLRLLYSFSTVTFLSALYEYSREKSYNHALELSKKYQLLANYDHLTQLPNRREALCILKREQARALRNKEPFSIALCDVDHFKMINDKYGHNGGDKVLIELAKLFTSNIREQDYVSRWGGEEFLFILPQTTPENASVVTDKIRKQLQKHTFNYESKHINVTVSMGIEQFNGQQSIDELINSADKYLYQAKQSGRNQIFPTFNSVDKLIKTNSG
jgi:diguanylate cyclase (GGDEF)-like protein